MSIQDDFEQRCLVEGVEDDVATARLRRDFVATGDLKIPSLPTVYRATEFRSALEASWAATLDTLRIAWEYEPETVTLPSGTTYIPDFKLPDIGAWLEVKGTGVPRVEKAIEFGKSLACDCDFQHCTCRWYGGELVLIGHPPAPYSAWSDPRFADTENINYRAMANAQRRHGGHPNWTSTRGRTAWLTRCNNCNRGTWFDWAQCRACRGPLAGSRGYQPGQAGVEFRRITGPKPAGDGSAEAA